MPTSGILAEGNRIEAVRYFRMAAEQGHSDAQVCMGKLYKKQIVGGVAQDGREAVRSFRMAAEQGHSDALFYLGTMFEHGDCAAGVDPDIDEAARFYLMAAQQGHSDAQTNLGNMLMNDVYAKDMNEAVLGEVVRHFRRAAERGNSEAQYYHGCLFEFGCGVAQDSAEAERYYLMAAVQGNFDATFGLEVMYEQKHDGGTKLNSIRALQHVI
jgi:hypothetical protein